jgi:hypothetical protein
MSRDTTLDAERRASLQGILKPPSPAIPAERSSLLMGPPGKHDLGEINSANMANMGVGVIRGRDFR